MNEAIAACNDLSARVLAGEDPSAEEINAVLAKLREQRSVQIQTTTGSKSKAKVDTGALLAQLMGDTP